MSLFKQIMFGLNLFHFRSLRLFLMAIVPLVLAACSFAPVYGDRANADAAFNLAFRSPGSRLEQIVINDLVARFGRSSSPDALLVAVKVSSSSVRPGPNTVALEGLITITDPGPPEEIIFTGTRSASASYSDSAQSLADQQASNEAAERAAHQLAETIRLTLISVLLNPQSGSDQAVLATP